MSNKQPVQDVCGNSGNCFLIQLKSPLYHMVEINHYDRGGDLASLNQEI